MMILNEKSMKTQSNPLFYQILNVAAVISTIIMNALVNLLPLNGVNTGQVSDSYPNLFTPPGYVFSIWGIIYSLAIIFMVYQARPSQRNEYYLSEIGVFYFLSAVLNISWLFIFHYSYGVPSVYLFSVIVLLLLLVDLILIYLRLGIGAKEVTTTERIAVHLPFSVYLGWISLASIASVASALNVLSPNIPVTMQAYGAAFMLVVALILSILMIYQRKDYAFGLVVIWASIGIAIKQMEMIAIYSAAVMAAVVVAAAIIIVFFRSTLKKREFP
jgi:hypothetical protein